MAQTKKSPKQLLSINTVIILLPIVLLGIILAFMNVDSEQLSEDQELGEHIMNRTRHIKFMYKKHKRVYADFKKNKDDYESLDIKNMYDLDRDFQQYYLNYKDHLMDSREDFDEYSSNKMKVQILNRMKTKADRLYVKFEELTELEEDII